MAKREKIGPFRVAFNKSRGKWFVDVPADLSATGKRSRPHFATKREATANARSRLSALSPSRSLSDGSISLRIKLSGVNLSEAANKWVERENQRVVLGKKRRSTLEKNVFQMKALTKALGHLDLAMIDETQLENYQRHRLSQGKKEATINDEISTLKALLRWAKRKGLLDEVPTVEQLRVLRKIVELPTPDEVAAIAARLPQDRRVLLTIFAETGCRASEAYGLLWTDIDEINSTISFQNTTVRGLKTESSVRKVPISLTLSREIGRLQKRSAFVFPSRDRDDKPMDNFRRALASAVEQASTDLGIKLTRITPQVMRKAVLTWHAESGTPESIAQQLCGHARGSRVTQQVYQNHALNVLRDAIIPLPNLERSRNDNPSRLATNGNKSVENSKKNKSGKGKP